MQRIAPSQAIEQEITALLEGDLPEVDKLSELGRLGARLVLQRSMDEEVEDFLQRTRYERTEMARGWRNGVRQRTIQTAEGSLQVAVPQVRGTQERFVLTCLPEHTRVTLRTRPLETLIIGAYVRGLSDRDITSLLAEAGLGNVSKSTVSQICRQLRQRYFAFMERSLEEVKPLVVFLDAIYLPTRPSGAKEGVLVAWCYGKDGKRVLLSVRLGQRESYQDWLDLARDLVHRGLPMPVLTVSDGAPGLVRVIEEVWYEALRQRCTVHKLHNVLAKLPKKDDTIKQQVRARYWAALDEAQSPAEAERRLRQLVGDLHRHYPSAADCLADDLPALTVHLYLPLRLRKRLRSTNLLERSLEEVRRRTKVMGRFPGETSCLTLVWAVMDLVIESGAGLGLTTFEQLEIDKFQPPRLAPQEQTA